MTPHPNSPNGLWARHGYTIEAADLATVRDGDEFLDLVAGAIRQRMR